MFRRTSVTQQITQRTNEKKKLEFYCRQSSNVICWLDSISNKFSFAIYRSIEMKSWSDFPCKLHINRTSIEKAQRSPFLPYHKFVIYIAGNLDFERRVVVNPRASSVVITKSPKHIQVKEEGVQRLKDAVSITSKKISCLFIAKHFRTWKCNKLFTRYSMQVVSALINKELRISNFSQSKYHPKPTDAWALDQLFVIDTLNFCFWTQPGEPKWTVCNESGYFALCAAVDRAIKNGIDIWNPAYYSNINQNELADILRGDDNETNIPLLDERVKCLRQVGRLLHDKYGGRFAHFVQEAGGSAKRMLRMITDEFPCFRDDADWGNVGVSLYKRAQILIGDIVSTHSFVSILFVVMLCKFVLIQLVWSSSGHVMKAKESVILSILMSWQCSLIIVYRKCLYISVQWSTTIISWSC